MKSITEQLLKIQEPTKIVRAKHFDSVFADEYNKLNITPEPLDYVDTNGQKKTYIYKSTKRR